MFARLCCKHTTRTTRRHRPTIQKQHQNVRKTNSASTSIPIGKYTYLKNEKHVEKFKVVDSNVLIFFKVMANVCLSGCSIFETNGPQGGA